MVEDGPPLPEDDTVLVAAVIDRGADDPSFTPPGVDDGGIEYLAKRGFSLEKSIDPTRRRSAREPGASPPPEAAGAGVKVPRGVRLRPTRTLCAAAYLLEPSGPTWVTVKRAQAEGIGSLRRTHGEQKKGDKRERGKCVRAGTGREGWV